MRLIAEVHAIRSKSLQLARITEYCQTSGRNNLLASCATGPGLDKMT